jgi:2-C-methyl-D-erythritol 2,4-cyclodiphosphate synthase
MRIGLGYDVHRLVAGRKLILGGVLLPFDRGLLGHSDADVLVHAICDALLGAAALGDIGQHFPDTDKRYKDIDSLKLLAHVLQLLEKDGHRIVNLDCTILAQVPKIAPYRDAMQKKLADVLAISENQINIKATTTEGLGFIGQEQGLGAMCVALID